MDFYNTNFKESNGQVIECEVQKYENGKITMSVTLKVGMSCKMKTNKKGESGNQFREGTIEEFVRDDLGNPIWAAIRFFDTNRVSKVELIKLV
ncbi:hypothetical protein J31TS6_61060 [Brevibacillus reuszeri]|uniref:hypothetical protein n=1 Tax=Brevibacillus reuszeri TaxID=54915 RepID=UPI001B1F7ACF|nr:hypothetical protein [Brevibacillus reuszeri]GIO10078.1 hypothetical protein J31TS6_61060 [Brevibacillus reuszeri]